MDLLSGFSIAPLHWQGLLTILLCGKPAGIRTSCLICMGTYIFVASSISLTGGSIDPSRVIGQVVTGIGFLGAGVILTRERSILGVISAATIWVLAAIGVVAGLERHATASVLALVTVGILVGVNLLERSFRTLRRGVHSQIVAKYQRRRDDDPATD